RLVVEGALMALRVGVAQDLEAALRALVADELDVAVQAVQRRPGGHSAVDARLRMRARPALPDRSGHVRRLRVVLDGHLRGRVAAALADREQVVQGPELPVGAGCD